MANEAIANYAQSILAQYGQRIADMLGLNLPDITFVVGATGGAAADTSGTTITLSAQWFKNHPDDAGGIVHEIVHAIIQDPTGDSKANEFIADAVRAKLGLTYGGWELSKGATRFMNLSAQNLALAAQELNAGVFTTVKNIGNMPATLTGTINTTLGPGETGGGTTTSTATVWVLNGMPVAPGTPGAIQMTLADYTKSLEQQQKQGTQNFKSYAQMLLSTWGIPMDANIQSLINQGTRQGWNTTTFQWHLEQTPEFHQAFPGIFDANGTLKMSPTEYLSTVRSYQSYAAQTGIDLNANQLSFLFRNDVSPAEFSQRAQALTTLRTNKAYFEAFNQQLKQQGMQPLSKGEQFKFVMGEGNQAWYDLWARASTRYSAEQTGIQFGHVASTYTNLGQKIVKQVAGLGLSQPQMQQGFAQLAKDLKTMIPMSRAQKFGLNKQDLVELEFGGPRQAAVAQRVQQILANEQAFLQNRVNRTGMSGGLEPTRTKTQQEFALGP